MTLAVDQLSLGQIGTNCYLVRADDEATDAVVIDPGDDAPEIERALEAGRDLHGDPARMATTTTSAPSPAWPSGPGARVAARGRARRLPPPRRLLHRRPDPGLQRRGDAAGRRRDGRAAGIAFQVRHVPGHSPGHLSFYADGHLFSGDVLFSGSVGRTDLPFGDWDTLLASIRSLTDAYPRTVVLRPRAGRRARRRLASNPFLSRAPHVKIERPAARTTSSRPNSRSGGA